MNCLDVLHWDSDGVSDALAVSGPQCILLIGVETKVSHARNRICRVGSANSGVFIQSIQVIQEFRHDFLFVD